MDDERLSTDLPCGILYSPDYCMRTSCRVHFIFEVIFRIIVNVTDQSVNSFSVEKVEVYHFHGNNQCPSCIAVGDLAEKTVNDNFEAELASGRLVFGHVDYDLPETFALAAKYGVNGSSLCLWMYDPDGFHKQQDLDVWYLMTTRMPILHTFPGLLAGG